jgi:hypothetical protein
MHAPLCLEFAFLKRVLLALAAILVGGNAAHAESQFVLQANMHVLRCDLPNATYRFVGSNAPGQIFLPGEPVDIKLIFTKGQDQGEVRDFAIEIQEITTRDPEARIKEAFTDTGGNAPLIALEGKPITHPIAVRFGEQPETAFEVKGVPVPARFGTYALVLTRGPKRQFLASLCRVPKPREDGRIDNVPIFGEGQMMGPAEMLETRAMQFYRMGVRGWRSELGWRESADGKRDWDGPNGLAGALPRCLTSGVTTRRVPTIRRCRRFLSAAIGCTSPWMWPTTGTISRPRPTTCRWVSTPCPTRITSTPCT